MAIYFRNKEAVSLYLKGSIIGALYRKGQLIYQAIKSCFGWGAWRNDKPWVNSEGWKNS